MTTRTKIDGKDFGFTWGRFAATGQVGADEAVTIDIDRALVSRVPSDPKRIES